MSKIRWFIIIGVLLLTTFTHLYRIDRTFTFHNDEARDVLIVKKMIDTKSPVLLGPQTSVGNMYLGPIYYYFMLPSLVMSDMHPVGPAIMVAIFGIMTTMLIFAFTSKKYGTWTGIIASLFYALSPVMLHYSRSSWNPNIIPFFVVLLLIAWDKKSRMGWFIFGLSAGVIFQLHYVALVMVALIGLVKLFTTDNKKEVLFGVLGFFLTSSPFWLFEMRHGFVNSQAFITFLKEGSQNGDINSTYLSRLAKSLMLNISGIIGSSSIMLKALPTYATNLFTFLIYIALPFVPGGISLWSLIVGSSLLVSYLKEPLHVHYISYLFPVISLALAVLVTRSHRIIRVVTFAMLVYLFWFSIQTLVYNLHIKNSSQVERAQKTAQYISMQSNDRPYNVVSTPGTYATTIEYFLSLSPNPPQTSLQKLVFDICEGNPCPLSDTTTVLFFGTGATHPSISDYLGHPALNEFLPARTIVKQDPVSYDIWVATMTIED